jgi:palmitoyl-protein thioesterase
VQYGNVNEQVQLVSEQLAAIPELENGFDAIGFSQGSLFGL